MTDLDQVLEAGTILMVTFGSYSDKGWNGPVRLLKAVTKRQLSDEFLAYHKAEEERKWPNPDDRSDKPSCWEFGPWLIKAGYAEDLPNFHDWYVGDWNFGDCE